MASGTKTAIALTFAALDGAAAKLSGSAAFAMPPALRGGAHESRVVPAVEGLGFEAEPASEAPKRAGFGSGVLALGALGAAAAFALGAGRRAASRPDRKQPIVLCAGPKCLEGTGGPFAQDCWDPAGLTKGKTDAELLQWRAAELKHGRVAMLACLGWFHVAAGYHIIGDAAARVRVSDDPLINMQQLPVGGALQVFFTLMCLEWLTTFICKPPANKPWDVLGWAPVIGDDEFPPWKENQLKELNNGRLAMVAIIGLIAQDFYTGDYFAGVSKPCFGNPICDIDLFAGGPFPVSPFEWPALYPHSTFESPEVIKMRELIQSLPPLEVPSRPADPALPAYLQKGALLFK